MNTVADFIIATLAQYGVKPIFGYPGAAILPLLESIRSHPTMEWVTTRHEATAAYAASAQGKLSANLSVCMSSSGPGASNLTTGILDAHLDRAPMLAITGLLPTWKQSRQDFQDIDQATLFASITGMSVECKNIQQLPAMLKMCIGYALKKRDVVHLAIPLDIQEAKVNTLNHLYKLNNKISKIPFQAAPKAVFDVVAQTLEKYQRIAIVVGPRATGAGRAIEALSDKLRSPILSTLSAKGIVNKSHNNAFGVLGIFGKPGIKLTRDILQEIELILTFGVDHLLPFLCDLDGQQKRAFIQCEPDTNFDSYQFQKLHNIFGPLNNTALALCDRVTQRKTPLEKTPSVTSHTNPPPYSTTTV